MNRSEEPLDGQGLKAALGEFGIPCSERTLWHAVKACGIKPIPGTEGRGRKHLYDPIAAWTIACVYLARKESLVELVDELDAYRLLAAHTDAVKQAVVGLWQAPEHSAQLLLICSLEYGIPPVLLLGMVRRKPELLEYCLFGSDYMSCALESYTRTYAEWLRDERLVDLELASSEPSYDGTLRQRFALRWMEQFVRANHAEVTWTPDEVHQGVNGTER